MKICVLNGSPKGEKSVTMQYVRFLEQAIPEHSFLIHHISNQIRNLEKNPHEWEQVQDDIKNSDILLWATPVYFQHVPGQYKRFVELLFERSEISVFNGKYTASLTTSVHFFDQKAHEYLQGVSEDLGMRYVGSFSAGMDDLFEIKNQEQLVAFGLDTITACQTRRPVLNAYLPIPEWRGSYCPGEVKNPVETQGKRVLILHDAVQGSQLDLMIKRMKVSFSGDITNYHLDDIQMKGGCLGCVQCAFENQCVYSDGYIPFWENTIMPADIIIYAGTIRDRYLSAQWKEFFDRSFFLGHIPRYSGKQFILMIDGPLAYISGLRENLSSLLSGGNLVDIITNEPDDSKEIDALISSAAERAVRYALFGYAKPPMFPAVAGHIVLRDAIWGDLRPIFRADHRYYRSHGLYDFPQYQYARRIKRFFFSQFMGIPQVQKKIKPALKDHMIQPYSKIFTKAPLIKGGAKRE